MGGRFTYYGESEGGNPNFAEEERWIFNTGAEVSFKASRVWDGAKNRLLDVNGLRHIFQPSLNYVYVPSPNVLPPQLPQFAYQNPSLRLLPLDYPDYNSIDSIDSMNAVRIGVRNKVQTKREEGVENLVNWAVYTDWRINPLDGTTNFLHGIPHFAISIGVQREGELIAGLILDVVRDEMFWADKGGGAFHNDRRLRVSGRRKLPEAVFGTCSS